MSGDAAHNSFIVRLHSFKGGDVKQRVRYLMQSFIVYPPVFRVGTSHIEAAALNKDKVVIHSAR